MRSKRYNMSASSTVRTASAVVGSSAASSSSPGINSNPINPTIPSNAASPPAAPQSNTSAGNAQGAQPSRPSGAVSPSTNASSSTQRTTWILRTFPDLSPRTNDLIAVVGLVLTVLGLGWALYSGAVGLRLEIWSARNEALQTCLAIRHSEKLSLYCNETIKAGVTPPPVSRRGLVRTQDLFTRLLSDHTPAFLAAICVVTLAAGILTVICSRSWIEPFRPVISMVKFQPSTLETELTSAWEIIQSTWEVTCTTFVGYVYTDPPVGLSVPGMNNDYEVISEQPSVCIGRKIGIFYDSEDDDADDDIDSPDRNDSQITMDERRHDKAIRSEPSLIRSDSLIQHTDRTPLLSIANESQTTRLPGAMYTPMFQALDQCYVTLEGFLSTGPTQAHLFLTATNLQLRYRDVTAMQTLRVDLEDILGGSVNTDRPERVKLACKGVQEHIVYWLLFSSEVEAETFMSIVNCMSIVNKTHEYGYASEDEDA